MRLKTMGRPLPPPPSRAPRSPPPGRRGTRHQLGVAAEFSILAPGASDRILSAPVDRFDMQEGPVDILVSPDRWNRVTLCEGLWRLSDVMIGGRASGHLLEDDHGTPFQMDQEASEYAAELLRATDPRCRAFDCSLAQLRRSSMLHIATEFDTPALVLAAAGLHGPGACSLDVCRAQIEVGHWRQDLLAWHSAKRLAREERSRRFAGGFAKLFEPGTFPEWAA